MTKYTLLDGSEIYINDDQICTKIENKEGNVVKSISLSLSNGQSFTVEP